MPPVRKRILLVAMVLIGVGGIFWWIWDGARRSRLSMPLLMAIERGEADTVRELLDQGANPDARVQDPTASHALLAFLRELFSTRSRHAHASAPTALLLAAQYNKEDVIPRMLLDSGADKEQPGEFSYSGLDPSSYGTPLIAAACNRHPRIVRLLLERGANPNAVSRTRQTALMFAAVKGEVGMTKLLLDRGADPNARDIYGNFPLGDAADWSQRYEAYPVVYDEDGKTPLEPEAAHLRVMQLLLAAGADPKARYPGGANALKGAAYGKHVDLVRFLLAQGADPRQTDKKGVTPLHAAADPFNDWDYYIPVARKLETLRLLFQAGADINARAKDGETALFLAAEGQEPAVVRLLLSHGANLNLARSNDQMTPLKAAADGNEAIYKLLMQAGAH